MNKQNQKQTRITGALRRLLFTGLPILALFITPLVSLFATSPVYAAGETYTWASSTTIRATGGNLPSTTTFTVSGNTAGATIELPQSGEDFCKPSLRLTIADDRKSATLAVFVTPSTGNPGDPGQNCSDAETVIDGWHGSTVQIGGDQGAESDTQMEVDVVLYNQYYKDDPTKAPKRVTFSIKSASGATASFKSKIAKDGNYYGTFYKVSEGSWTYCVDKIDTECQTKTKIKYQPGSVAFGEFSKGAIRVELDVNPRIDDPNESQTIGPLTIELRDKDDKVLDTKDVTLEYPGCDPDKTCGGAIHLFKTFDFNKVQPGEYKVCYGDKCEEVTKKQRTLPTVKLAINQSHIDEAGTASEDGEDETTCAVDGVGWIVCPMMTFMGTLNDAAFGFLNNLLEVRPALFTDDATRTAWSAFRDLANVAFVVAFLFIVYSQVTGVGVSNYGVKKLLPRIFVAALLVNLSYWICAVAVDLSNIVGGGSYQLLKDSIVSGGGGGGAASETWSNITAVVLAGATGLVLLFILIPVLPTVLLAAAVILLILIARQALVIMLIVIAPLAFVAYLLPNTEDWFKKWRKAFVATLMVYPIIGVVFGASTLASNILMRVSEDGTGGGDDEQMLKIVALAVMAVPLFAVPALLKGSLSAAGAIGAKLSGIADSTNRMAGNRLKEEAKAKQDIARSKALAGEGFLGRKGVGSLYRSAANRRGRLDRASRRAGAAEKSFLNDETTKRGKKEQDVLKRESAASTQQGINKAIAEKGYLKDNVELNVRAKVSDLELDVQKAKDAALVKELGTHEGADKAARAIQAAGASAATATDLASRAQSSSQDEYIQKQRTASADRVEQLEHARAISSTPALAAEAGGIDEKYGAQRATAAAAQVIDKAIDEAIVQEKKTMESSDPEELFEIMRDTTASSERRAAAAGMIMKAGGDQHVHEVLDYLGTADVSTPEAKEAIIYAQKQAAADIGGRKPFSLGNTDISLLAQGGYGSSGVTVDASGNQVPRPPKSFNDSLIDRINKGKLAADDLAKMSSDELARVAHVIATRGNEIDSAQVDGLLGAVQEVNTNETLRGSVASAQKQALLAGIVNGTGIPPEANLKLQHIDFDR